MSNYYIDFETYSELDVRDCGAHRYARHPSTRPILCGWAKDDHPVRVWKWGDPLPFVLEPEDSLISHNIEFDATIARRFFGLKFQLHQLYDTAALSVHCGLPRGLDMASRAVGTEYKKVKGKKLIDTFCAPPWTPERYTGPQWEEFIEYCRFDTEVCRELFKRLPPMLPPERVIFLEHLNINYFGVPIDQDNTAKLNDICKEAERMLRATPEGKILFSPVAIVRWLAEQGIEVPNARADTLESLALQPDCPPHVRRLIDLRTKAAKASTKKLSKILEYDAGDGIIRGIHTYFGGHTGRFSGAGPQFQNLIRECADDINGQISLLEALPNDPVDAIAILGTPEAAIEWASLIIRPMIKAPPGKKFIAADFTAIEARELAWLAGAEHILKLYREGVDLYAHMASKIYKIPTEKISKKENPELRRIGKNSVLGCGYGLGAAGFVAYAAANGSPLTLEESKIVVSQYRESIPEVPDAWRFSDNCIERVMSPEMLDRGVMMFGEKLILWTTDRNNSKKPAILLCRLPSGRIFRWHFPAYVEIPGRKPGTTDMVFSYASHRGDPKRSISATINFRAKELGIDPAPFLKNMPQTPGGWLRLGMWGGSFIENIIQAISRELLCWAMIRMRRAGMPVTFHVHDELVVLATENTAASEVYDIMNQVPAWNKGAVIDVEGWEGPRYKK